MTDTQMNDDHRLLPHSYSMTYFTLLRKYNMEWSCKKTEIKLLVLSWWPCLVSF